MSAHDPRPALYRAVKPRAILPMVRAGFMLDLCGAAVNTGGIALAAHFSSIVCNAEEIRSIRFRPPHEKE
jgi:hypothetical protein